MSHKKKLMVGQNGYSDRLQRFNTVVPLLRVGKE